MTRDRLQAKGTPGINDKTSFSAPEENIADDADATDTAAAAAAVIRAAAAADAMRRNMAALSAVGCDSLPSPPRRPTRGSHDSAARPP